MEWEDIKRVGRDSSLLDKPGLEKKAIKVISALITSLPKTHNYRVIYMRRPIEEIVVSQKKMLDHRGTAKEGAKSDKLGSELDSHAKSILRFMRRQPETFQILEVDYPTLVSNPEKIVGQIIEFIGPERLPHPEKLAGAIQRDLYRNKAT